MTDALPPDESPPPFVERRESVRSEMMEVVMTVVATLNEVITALRGEIVALGENEQRGRRRLTLYLIALGLVGLVSVVGMAINYNQSKNVKSIVHYIQECQTPNTECKNRADASTAAAVTSISTKAFDSITCVLSTLPQNRTDENIKGCRDQYLGASRP